jgi:osmotically-inducible protein OsmY
MSDQNRWNEDRTRDSSRRQSEASSGRDYYQGDRDNLRERDEDRYSGAYGRYANFGGRPGQRDSQGDLGAYGADAYGIPSDYNYGRDRNSGYSYGAGYESGRYGQALSGQGYLDNRQDYGREYEAGRYQGGRRAQEDRSFWNQTRDEVSSWFGDDEARRRRQDDEMRAGEHRGRGPKGYIRSDERIRDDVSDLLSDNARLDASDIEVTVSGGEVTLTGTVGQKAEKRLAEDLADSALGAKHVQNNLRLKEGASGTATRIPVGATGGATASSASGAAGGQGGAQTRAN